MDVHTSSTHRLHFAYNPRTLLRRLLHTSATVPTLADIIRPCIAFVAIRPLLYTLVIAPQPTRCLVSDDGVTHAESATWTSQEVCERLSIKRPVLHRMLFHVEQVFGFKALRLGTLNQHTALFKTAEVELLERVYRFAERLGPFSLKYSAAAIVVFNEMEQDGTLGHFETAERKLQRLRSQVAALEEAAAQASAPIAPVH